MTRRKSGNYTVRRPLELGAALAGAGEPVLAVLGEYGGLVGEAFQLRDDVLGVFGAPDVTGKPSGGDLLEHKATSLVVLAADMASPVQDAELTKLSQREDLADGDIDRWRQLIIDTGATVRIEQMIRDRVTAACAALTRGAAHGGSAPSSATASPTWPSASPTGPTDRCRRRERCGPSPGAPTTWWWPGPGWPGWPPPCTWPAAAARSPSSSARSPRRPAGRLDVGGYRFDTGPTVLTMPDLVAEALAAVGENLTDRLDLVGLDPAYRAAFADGSTLDVHTDADAMTAAVREFAGPAEAAGYQRLRAWLTELYQQEFGQFIAANFDSPLSLVTPALARLVALGAFRRLEPAIGRFISDERLRRVFSFQSLYAGESPKHALAVYAVIAYMDTVAGVYFPRGGMRAVPDALAAAAAAAGVKFHYGQSVTALERSGNRVTAVRTPAACGCRATPPCWPPS